MRLPRFYMYFGIPLFLALLAALLAGKAFLDFTIGWDAGKYINRGGGINTAKLNFYYSLHGLSFFLGGITGYLSGIQITHLLNTRSSTK